MRVPVQWLVDILHRHQPRHPPPACAWRGFSGVSSRTFMFPNSVSLLLGSRVSVSFHSSVEAGSPFTVSIESKRSFSSKSASNKTDPSAAFAYLASWRTQTKARRAKPSIVTTSSNEGDETKEASQASSSVTEVTKPAISEKRAQAEAEVKKGQRTAIVTGVISVLLGVGYLVLIQLLDTRGIILVPPPPEAFDP